MRNGTLKSQEIVNFGSMIRERRRALGLSEEAFAERANRSDREVRDIELGKTEPLLGTALLLCNACGVDVGELKNFIPQADSTKHDSKKKGSCGDT